MPLFALFSGWEGCALHIVFFNFALPLHFGYLLPWILSGGMNTVFRVSELGIRSEVLSYVNRNNISHVNDWEMTVACV